MNNGGPTETVALRQGVRPSTRRPTAPSARPPTSGAPSGTPQRHRCLRHGRVAHHHRGGVQRHPGSPTVTVSGSGSASQTDLGASSPAGCWSVAARTHRPTIQFDRRMDSRTARRLHRAQHPVVLGFLDHLHVRLGLHPGRLLPSGHQRRLVLDDPGGDHLQRHRLVRRTSSHPVALVTNPGPNTVTPIDTTTGTAGTHSSTSRASPRTSPSPPTVPPATWSGPTRTWSPAQPATDAIGSTITVGNRAQGIAITPDGSTAYVANGAAAR